VRRGLSRGGHHRAQRHRRRVGGAGRSGQNGDRADRAGDPRGAGRGIRLSARHARDGPDDDGPPPDGLRRGVRYELRGRPDHHGRRHRAADAPETRAGGPGQNRGAADVHELLAGVDFVRGILLPELPRPSVHVQVAAANVRRGGEDLLRPEDRQEAGRPRGGFRDAVHGEEVGGAAARDERQRRARRGPCPDHARAGADDPPGQSGL